MGSLGRPVAVIDGADDQWIWNADRGTIDGVPIGVEITYTRSALLMASVETLRPIASADAPPASMHHATAAGRFVAQTLRAEQRHGGLRMSQLMEQSIQSVKTAPATDTELVIEGIRHPARRLTREGCTSVMTCVDDVLVICSVSSLAGPVPNLRWTQTSPGWYDAERR
ncbi:hypothetical protein [Kitasatospora sp. NPDC092286]|uniref:hypothetical protein n=1 Tax=Kitasatospora sp. NPDC092286 TaxID=3364087 RepID=UPI003805720A